MGIVYGVVAGLIAAVPLLVALRQRSIVRGIVADIVAFAAMHAIAVLVWQLDPASLVPFATCFSLSFLAAVMVIALRRL